MRYELTEKGLTRLRELQEKSQDFYSSNKDRVVMCPYRKELVLLEDISDSHYPIKSVDYTRRLLDKLIREGFIDRDTKGGLVYYHITEVANLPSILERGLTREYIGKSNLSGIASIEGREGGKEGVYLFSGSGGTGYPKSSRLVSLKITLPKTTKPRADRGWPGSGAVVVSSDIPPESIEVDHYIKGAL